MPRPKVSVIIPTYNRAGLLHRALQSVFAQTYQDLQILVIDDGSTDDTASVIPHDAIRVVCQAHQGVSAARNHGIQLAQGQYIAFLDSDDEFLPEKCEKQVKYLEAHPQIGMVYSAYYEVNEGTGVTRVPLKPLLSGNVFRELLWRCAESPLVTPTVLVRRDVFDSVGLFDETMDLAEDIDLWCRISRRFEIGSLAEPLSRIHRHPGNISGKTDPERNLKTWLYLINKAFRDPDQLNTVYKRRLYAKVYAKTWETLFLYRGKHWLATRYLLRALTYWPILSEPWSTLARWPGYFWRSR